MAYAKSSQRYIEKLSSSNLIEDNNSVNKGTVVSPDVGKREEEEEEGGNVDMLNREEPDVTASLIKSSGSKDLYQYTCIYELMDAVMCNDSHRLSLLNSI